MNTHLSHRSSLTILAGFFIVFAIAAAIIFSNYDITIQPKNPPTQGCQLDALMCPDGTTVGRVPPSCEFAHCPPVPPTTIPTYNEPSQGGGVVTVSSAPIMPGESAMAQVPDLPLGNMPDPSSPLSVTFVVEHRSGFNNKRIALTGIVVSNNLKEPECDNLGCPMMYSQPYITLAESTSTNRNILYDIPVSFPEEARSQADQYPVGSTVTITATVEGSLEGIRMTQ